MELLCKFTRLSSLTSSQNTYNIRAFLNDVGGEYPDVLVGFFLNRIRSIDVNDTSASISDRFEPIPHPRFKDCFEKAIGSPSILQLLRDVRDESYKSDKNYYYRRLFRILSNDFSSDSIEILDEWVNQNDKELLIAVCDLIIEAKSDFLFKYPEFVNSLILKSSKLDETCHKKVWKTLFHIAQFEQRTGSIREPFPLDIKIRDKSEEFASKYPKNSLTRKFYLNLAGFSNKRIEESILEDEELFER